AELYFSSSPYGYESVCESMCSAAIFLYFLPTARATGTVTEPSPPIVIGTAPACTMRSTACSVRSKASTIFDGVSLTLPQSTRPSAATGSKSALVGLKRRISADCWRTESGPPRAPMRMLVPQSNGMPRMAALLPGPGRPYGAPMKVVGEVKSSSSGSRSIRCLGSARLQEPKQQTIHFLGL